MIAVDTFALMAILLGDREADACSTALTTAERLLISSGTVAEALVVAGRRNVAVQMHALIYLFGAEIVSVTSASARRVAAAYERWGKGVHPAGLNFGDCFAYDVAKEHDCKLLYVGEDFAKTDVLAVL